MTEVREDLLVVVITLNSKTYLLQSKLLSVRVSQNLKCINLVTFCFVGQSSQRGAPPPYGFHLSEEATAEDIRLRRLRRFDS